ncbi:MAG: hypothetical protein U5L45_23825 [Saprospiraceae bacterium]|nr:hypothetical protein [Saprospiraceae bacterium]
MVHFSGKARKMNHFSPFFASEAINKLALSRFARKSPKSSFLGASVFLNQKNLRFF